MVAFQPYSDDDYAYPGGAVDLGGNLGNAAGITETSPGSRLGVYQVGDYAYPAIAPIPHVEMTLFTFNPAMQTITVYRTAVGRTSVVRGQIRVYAVGGRNVVDWEAPFGVPITYRAEQFDVDGQSLGFTEPFSTQLDVTETWLHNVFEPSQGITITPAGDWAKSLSRPIPTDTYWASGGGLATGIFGQRHGLTDAPIPFLTFTEDDADTVRDMFGDPYTSPSATPVVCIRTGAGKNMRLPKPFYAAISDPLEVPLDTPYGGSLTRWECTGTEVNPPAPALVAAVLTYADLDASYATYGARDAAYSSYLEEDRDYSLAGTADGA